MSPLRVLRGFVFGGLGGVLGWFLIEFLPFGYPFQPWRMDASNAPVHVASPTQEAITGLVFGLALGAFLGVAEGLAEGTMGRFRRAVVVFLLFGPVGGFLGFYFGQFLFGQLGGKISVAEISGAEFFPQILIRSVSWLLIGLFLGVVYGLPDLSARRMWNGAVGGALGGFLGGFVLQVLSFTGLFRGMQLRLIGFALIGAAIGFFINFIVEVMKQVWVKVLIGRNEGREHVLDTPLAYVGRDELADIPVFLDPSVPKRMASFRLTSGRYGLYPESSALPVLVNGQSVTPGHVLSDGDAIQFGRVTLAYFEKATATGSRRPVDTIPLADFSHASVVRGAVPIPDNPNLCEFCGQQRDPATGACACSVEAAPDAYGGPGGYDASGYPGGYAPPDYAPAADYGAPPGYGYAPNDPAYAATVMAPPDPGYGAAPAGPRLVGTAGPYAGQVFPLGGMEIGIGREPSQTISLTADSTASRRHARLFPSGNLWMIRDEGSSNGTWVNGARIQEQPLYPGDEIRVGGSQFRFEA